MVTCKACLFHAQTRCTLKQTNWPHILCDRFILRGDLRINPIVKVGEQVVDTHRCPCGKSLPGFGWVFEVNENYIWIIDEENFTWRTDEWVAID